MTEKSATADRAICSLCDRIAKWYFYGPHPDDVPSWSCDEHLTTFLADYDGEQVTVNVLCG